MLFVLSCSGAKQERKGDRKPVAFVDLELWKVGFFLSHESASTRQHFEENTHTYPTLTHYYNWSHITQLEIYQLVQCGCMLIDARLNLIDDPAFNSCPA